MSTDAIQCNQSDLIESIEVIKVTFMEVKFQK